MPSPCHKPAPGATGAPTAAEAADYLAVAERLAREAGAMIADAFVRPAAAYDRKSANDPVTETDRAVEAFLFRELRAAFPAHAFIGEESAADAPLSDALTWIVDVSCAFAAAADVF
jgi:myo-inositol-1(or 4)-monophosphatase